MYILRTENGGGTSTFAKAISAATGAICEWEAEPWVSVDRDAAEDWEGERQEVAIHLEPLEIPLELGAGARMTKRVYELLDGLPQTEVNVGGGSVGLYLYELPNGSVIETCDASLPNITLYSADAVEMLEELAVQQGIVTE